MNALQINQIGILIAQIWIYVVRSRAALAGLQEIVQRLIMLGRATLLMTFVRDVKEDNLWKDC